MTCPICKGQGYTDSETPTDRGTLYEADGCDFCEGSGTVSKAELAEYEASKTTAREYLAGLPDEDYDYDPDSVPF